MNSFLRACRERRALPSPLRVEPLLRTLGRSVALVPAVALAWTRALPTLRVRRALPSPLRVEPLLRRLGRSVALVPAVALAWTRALPILRALAPVAALALSLASALTLAAAVTPAQAAESSRSASANPIAVRMVVVANFENGADVGDKPGEYQFWVEREHLDETLAVRGAAGPVRRNQQGLYGLLLGNLAAFLLDPRFDFSKTYWLFTGISGADPQVASVGSAAWARWVVNGDELREIDDREIPAGWPYGLFAIGSMKPNTLPTDPNSFGSVESADELSMAYPLNRGLAQWAFNMTRSVVIPDTPQLAKQREAWKGYPNAQRPPFVLLGETLGSVRYWHGPRRTQWARDWVKLWTHGKGTFVMTNMESQTAARLMVSFTKLGFVDLQRVMVLRTASNASGPPPGVDPLASIGDEAPGQVAAYEANYRVGAPVVHELLGNWSRYQNAVPQAAFE